MAETTVYLQTMADAHQCEPARVIVKLPTMAEYNGLTVACRTWSPQVGERLTAEQAANPSLDVAAWLEALEVSEVLLTSDGRGAVRDWCRHSDGESAPLVYYERWTPQGRLAHGYVCHRSDCRRITQAG